MMRSRSKMTCKPTKNVITVLGAMSLIICNGMMIYWGNMAVYVTSYFLFGRNEANAVDSSPWTLSFFNMFFCIGVLIFPLLLKFFGSAVPVVVGIVLADVGILSSYFSVQTSFLCLMISFGPVNGLGTGVLYGTSMRLATSLETTHTGLFISLVQGSFNMGCIGINKLITGYLNPLNRAPEYFVRNHKYFTQTDVLNKVPSMFLILGGISAAVHAVGFAVLRGRGCSGESTSAKEGDGNERRGDKAETDSVNANETCRKYDNDVPELGDEKRQVVYGTLGRSLQKMGEDSCVDNAPLPNARKPLTVKLDGTNEISPREMLQTVTFYAFWTGLTLANYTYLVMLNFYKVYAQIWIADDHFLTDVAISMSVVSLLMRPITGLFLDRVGSKNCFIVVGVVCTNICSWYYCTPRVGKWCYTLALLVFWVLPGAHYACGANAIAVIFGKTHFSSNYACLKTSMLVANTLAPSILGTILARLGWFYVFLSAGLSQFAFLVLIIVFLPRTSPRS